MGVLDQWDNDPAKKKAQDDSLDFSVPGQPAQAATNPGAFTNGPINNPAAEQKPQPGLDDLPSQYSFQNPQTAPGGTSTTKPVGKPQSVDNSKYAASVANISKITDPKQKAIAQDALARTVYADLKAAGHDVKWDGTKLVVDGRPYDIGGAESSQGPTSSTQSFPDYQQGSDPWQYFLSLQQGQAPSPKNLLAMKDKLKQAGIEVLTNASGVAGKIRTPDGVIHDVIEAAGLGGKAWQDLVDDGSGGAPGGNMIDPSLVPSYLQTALPTAPNAPTFEPTAPGYTPGDISLDDIPSVNPDELSAGLPNLGPGDTDPATKALIQRILGQPESLDAQTVATLKAKNKNSLAEMFQNDDEELQKQGVALGIDDSRWLAAERAGGARARDAAMAKSNQDLDVTAATTNAADRRSAAELGMSYGSQTASQALAARSQLFGERAQGVTLQLDAAAATGNRLALREQVKQTATQLGISQDQVRLQYTLGIMNDLTQRWGIEVNADLDMKKLLQGNSQFLEDLAFKYAQLQQADSQFGAEYGLNVAQLQETKDQNAWNRYMDTLNLGG
jgi:hypothetical protein